MKNIIPKQVLTNLVTVIAGVAIYNFGKYQIDKMRTSNPSTVKEVETK